MIPQADSVLEVLAGHFEPTAVKRDQRRNNRSILGGYLVLRYYYADVVYSPDEMVAELLAILELRRRGTFDAR